MNKRKGVSTKTSPNDQSFIKYIFYNYDPEEIQTLKFTFKIGKTYLKDQKAGEILLINGHNSNNSTNSQKDQKDKIQGKINAIKFFDTGSVDSISSNLEKVSSQNQEYYVVKKTIQKKHVLQLFQMKLCEHIPTENKVKQLIEEQKKVEDKQKSKIKKVQKVNPIFCKKCEERLYFFYLEEQKSITWGEVQKQFQIEEYEQDIKNIDWSVMLGQKFTKTTQIAKLDDKQFYIEENGKISFLIDWRNLQQEPQKSTQVLKYRPIYCQHQKIQSNICQYCFQQVDPIQLNFKKYLFQMQQKDDFKRQMITTGSTLVEQQNKFVDDLIERQRGILILDLDNTVLHSIQLGQIHKTRLDEMEEFYQLMIGSIVFNKYIVTSCFIVKMRPYFKDFIETAINFYEVYVYTKGTRSYAQQICNAIRNQYASKDYPSNNKNQKIEYYEFLKDKNAFTPSRIITRDEDPDLEKKSLSNILPTRQENLMVMDDLASVWNYSSSVLNTVPFHFFFKKKIIESQKIKNENGNGNHTKRNYHKALDECKEGEKLQAVQDLHVQTFQPVRELPCDHFQREVAQIQNDIFQSVKELPCDILQKQVKQITQRQIMLTTQVDSNGDIKPIITTYQSLQREQSEPKLIEITKGIAPEDKDYDYDILPRSDYYLIYAAHNLLEIHNQFFTSRKSTGKPNEKKLTFGQLNRKMRFDLLSGTTIKFCMNSQTKIDIYWRSIKLGCKILPFDSDSTPQYIIRLNNLKSNISRMYFKKEDEEQRKEILKKQSEIQKETVKQLKHYSQTMKIPIVSQSWIQFCYSFTYQFPVQPFIIDSDDILKDIHQQEFQWVIEEHAHKLLKTIKERNIEVEKNKIKKSQII